MVGISPYLIAMFLHQLKCPMQPFSPRCTAGSVPPSVVLCCFLQSWGVHTSHDQIIAVSKSLSRRLFMTYPTENMKEPNAASSWREVVRVDSECFFCFIINSASTLCVEHGRTPFPQNRFSFSFTFNIFQHLSTFSTIEGTKCAKDNGGPNCMTSQKAHRRPFSTASWSNQDFCAQAQQTTSASNFIQPCFFLKLWLAVTSSHHF